MDHRLTLSILGLVALVFSGATFTVGAAMADVNEPVFKLVSQDGDVEIRDYSPVLVAQMSFVGNRDRAVRAGFELLSGYISGDNEATQKIAMTAPIAQFRSSMLTATLPGKGQETTDEAAEWTVRFMMPNGFTLNKLPKPDDRRITVVEVPARRVAALRFSGLWTDSNFTTHRDQLAAWLKSKGLKPVGEPTYAYYDPPWQPFFWRRNEILWDIAPK